MDGALSEGQAEWARCRPWIEAAVEYCGGTHTIEDVEADIAAGDAQFWPGKKAAVVTQVTDFPRFRGRPAGLAAGDENLRLRAALEHLREGIGR